MSAGLAIAAWEAFRKIAAAVGNVLLEQVKRQPIVTALVVLSFIRLFGTTIYSGWKGVLFRFGRARRVLEPGFVPLLPVVHIVRKTRVRSITLDLREQRVMTSDGLVYDVDVNLVYRVRDPMKALIEVDDIKRGCATILALVTQDVLRQQTRATITERTSLAEELTTRAQARLDDWGIEVDRAGFTSIAPTIETLRLTQLAPLVRERAAALGMLRGVEATGSTAYALALVGSDRNLRSHAYARYRVRRAIRRRRRRPVLSAEERRLLAFVTGDESIADRYEAGEPLDEQDALTLAGVRQRIAERQGRNARPIEVTAASAAAGAGPTRQSTGPTRTDDPARTGVGRSSISRTRTQRGTQKKAPASSARISSRLGRPSRTRGAR